MKKSFTLIELLIVLIIIGVLVTLAMPQYQSLVIRARGAEAMNNLRSVSDSILRYYIENGDFPNGFDMHPNDLGLDTALGASKDFEYVYYAALGLVGASVPRSGIAIASYIDSANAPVGAIIRYETFFSGYSPIHNVDGETIQGEEVGERLYRYYVHYTKGDTVTKLGWP